MSPPTRDRAWLAWATLAVPVDGTRAPIQRPRWMSDVRTRVRAMMVFSNQRLGPAAELLVSPEVATAMLRATVEAARPVAESRWEHELIAWLEDRATTSPEMLDVGEIAWSPENFERQRKFLTDAIERASLGSEHARALALWSRMIGAHHRQHVVVGRRWPRSPSSATA